MKIELTEKIKDLICPELEQRYNAAEDYMIVAQIGDANVAYQYYYGMLPKANREGACSYVDRTCQSTVNGALQDLMTCFTSGEAVEFAPTHAEDVYSAKAATDLVNQIVLRNNDGYRVLEGAIKEALIARTGWIKRYWVEEDSIQTVQAHGVAEEEIEAYLMGLKEAGIEIEDDNIEAIQQEDGSFDLTVTYKTTVKKVKLEHTPLEEIRIDQQARTIADTNYFCHVSPKNKEEILRYGYPEDKVDQLDDYLFDISQGWELNFTRSGGRQDTTQDSGSENENLSFKVKLKEHYFRTSLIANDGTAHLYKVYEAGREYFGLEEVSEIPFTCLSPLPIPGSVFGESVVDLVSDIQDLRSWVKRSMIDNANMATYGRYIAIQGSYDRRALLDNRPGGVVETQRPDAIELMPYHPLPQGLDFLLSDSELEVEKRTGVSRLSQGINADVLKGDHGFDSINMLLSAAQGRIRYMARTLANNGVKELMLAIYNLYRENGEVPLDVATSQGVVKVAPNALPPRTNIKVAVALSPQEKEEKAMKVERLIQDLTALSQVQNEFISPVQKHYLTQTLIESLGFKNTNDFIIPLAQYQPPQPMPDPVAMAQAQLLQAQANKLVNDAQVETERLAFEQQHAADKLKLDSNQFQFEQEKGADEIKLKSRELDIKANVEAGKAQHNAEGNLIKNKKVDNDAVKDQASIMLKGREGLAKPAIASKQQ